MRQIVYETAEGCKWTPFDRMYGNRDMVFRIESPEGTRFDRANLCEGDDGELTWLWPGHIPNGRVTLIEGAPGSGKSLVALDLAARVCTDRPWPDGSPQPRPGAKAAILCRQDHAAHVVGARLAALGVSAFRFLQFHDFDTVSDERSDCRPLSFPFDLPALEHILASDKDLRLIVIDSLSDFCPGKRELAECLQQLSAMADNWGRAIIVTLRATARFDRQGQLVVKSGFDTAAARCIWCCVDDPRDRKQKLFVPTLLNYAELPPGRAFRPVHLGLEWQLGEITPHDPLHSLSDCGKWLKELLEEGDQFANEIQRLGKEFDFSKRQIYQARLDIQARFYRETAGPGSHVKWTLKKTDDEEQPTRGNPDLVRNFAEPCSPGTAVDETQPDAPPRERARPKSEVPIPNSAAGSGQSGSKPRSAEPSSTGTPLASAAPNSMTFDPNGSLPWLDSPSSRLMPLFKPQGPAHHADPLPRKVKSMKSTESNTESKM